MNALVWFSRIFVGLLFIFSGLIKANDPLGFSYKLEEYFVVFGMEWMSFSAVILSILICALEIVLGVALILGLRAKTVSWLLLGLILFFTWLTGYSAVTNKVTDCGCFGDFIKLTPWQSFTKDLILLVFIGIIFFNRKHIQPLVSYGTEKSILWISSVLSVAFGVYCYFFLPVVDMLPYKVGNNLPELMKIPEGAPVDVYETRLFYEKDGVVKEFTLQNYPWNDSTYKWVKTESVLISPGYKPKVKDLRLVDSDGNEYTDDIIQSPKPVLLVVAYDLKKTQESAFHEIGELVVELEKNKIRTIGLTASPAYETEVFRHEENAPFEFYFCDGITLKTMIRSNPGLILLENGTVLGKWPSTDLPDTAEITSLLQQ